MKLLCLLVFALLVADEARAEENLNDGNTLHVECRLADVDPHGSLEYYKAGFCAGMIRGVTTVSNRVCVLKGVTINQEIKVVVKYLQDNPATLQLDGADLTEEALAKAFPCAK